MDLTDRKTMIEHIAQLTKASNAIEFLNIETATLALQKTMDVLKKNRPYYHWVGIYGLLSDKLYLGPFSGPPTDHLVIPVGRGVCGTAVKERTNQVIGDVSQLDNYLACNLETKSELVVLIWNEDQTEILGQIDVDGSSKNAFGKDEELFLEQVGKLLSKSLQVWLADRKKKLANP